MKTKTQSFAGSFRRTFITLVALALLAASAPAQVPTMISYQGRVLVNNTNFNGSGQFKFALVQGAGPTLLWKNDGSAGNTEPAAAVTLPVSNGLVMTLLGDTLAGMTAIPTTVFVNTDVRLRVWFNGGAGSQQLTPDQRVVSVGYAMMSANVPDGSITSAKLAPGAINSAQLADTIALGATNVVGRLDVYSTAANTPSISLIGSASQISTYGSDGLEQIRLWGAGYGEIILHNGLANNAIAATLTAQSSIGGQLSLNSSNGSTRALLEGENSGGQLTLYQADGQVGVFADGDSSGAGLVSVRGTNGSTRATLDGSDGGGGAVRLYENDGTETVSLTSEGNGNLVLRQGDGSSGVGLFANNGSGGGAVTIYRDSGTFAAQLTVADTTHDDGYLGLADATGVTRFYARAWNGTANGGYLGILNAAGSQVITMDSSDTSGDGRITTQVLQITGGSDLSENFDIKAIHDELKAGMIVCIDPQKPGQLVTSSKPYDTTVAGIISGAGGVKTGMLMGQRGSPADGQHAVALSGRVYCWVDADKGAIRPGDLITTGTTPGHGMKVKDSKKAQGAIIGKAMSPLEKGKGLVLVLVSLQ